MGKVTLEGKDLHVALAGNQTMTSSLASLRAAYLFLPKTFKWRVVLPSQHEYRWVEVEAMSSEEVELLRTQLGQLGGLLSKDFLFVLKDFAGQSAAISLKDFKDAGIDILAELARYKDGWEGQRAEWLAGDPQVVFSNVAFSQHQVQQGSRIIPWPVLDRIELTQTQSLGTTSYFRFIPVKKQGAKLIAQGMPPARMPEFIAEYDFWSKRGLTAQDATAAAERKVDAANKSRKIMRTLWLLLGAVIVVGIILVVVVMLLSGM